MKNLIFGLMLISSFLSCNSTKTMEETTAERVVSGWIQSLEFSSFQYGTHLLLNDDDVVLFALTSETVDLDEFVDTRFADAAGAK